MILSRSMVTRHEHIAYTVFISRPSSLLSVFSVFCGGHLIQFSTCSMELERPVLRNCISFMKFSLLLIDPHSGIWKDRRVNPRITQALRPTYRSLLGNPHSLLTQDVNTSTYRSSYFEKRTLQKLMNQNWNIA
jgi:hypothetical protein